MSDYSFSLGDEDLAHIDQTAEEFQRHYKEGGNGQGGDWPMSAYLGEGHHTFRIYPDRDERGFARLMRGVFMHNPIPINDKGDTVRIWADPRVDDIFKAAEDAGLVSFRVGDKERKTWMFKSREVGVMCVHWIDTSTPDKIPVGHTSLVILDKRQMFAFNEFISQQHPEDKRKLIDPNGAAPGIRFSVTKNGAKTNVSCGISGMRSFPMPLPPMMLRSDKEGEIPFVGLNELFITEEAQITDEQLAELDSYITKQVSTARNNNTLATNQGEKGFKFGDKAKQGAVGGSGGAQEGRTSAGSGKGAAAGSKALPGVPDKAEPLDKAVAEGTGERHCPLAEKITAMPSKAAEFGQDVKFGNRPSKSNPYCSVCENEDDCNAATVENKNAKAA